MDDKYRKILSEHPSIPPEKLLAYLEGGLDEQSRIEVEMAMVESEFLSDAADGLQQFRNPEMISGLVEDINRGLRHRTGIKKRPVWRRDARFPLWLTFAAIILFLLIITGFIVIKLMTRS
jgi:hypothetical protein